MHPGDPLLICTGRIWPIRASVDVTIVTLLVLVCFGSEAVTLLVEVTGGTYPSDLFTETMTQPPAESLLHHECNVLWGE